jgi:hypothetical protein
LDKINDSIDANSEKLKTKESLEKEKNLGKSRNTIDNAGKQKKEQISVLEKKYMNNTSSNLNNKSKHNSFNS